jgi:hypothetical protein
METRQNTAIREGGIETRMTSINTIEDRIGWCVSVILKEAREEKRLVKQILYCMLSAYTNNPINLAINAPTGEGKNYILQKVGDLFPKNDVIFLAGLTEKAVYHKEGVLVIKSQSGEYRLLTEIVNDLDDQIADKESEIARTTNKDLKQVLQVQIKELEQSKKDIPKSAMKLIDLSHKILVILDTPSPGLFAALMSLLSHDRYEAEYEFTDKDNATGIKTRSNILRGWPVVIFAQAIDYSSYKRWPEVQRRFIITNPKMDRDKYDAAIDLIGARFGLPDFAYEAKVVSDIDKDLARGIIEELRDGLLDLTKNSKPGKNNTIIPFYQSLHKSLSREKASDMTTAHRLFTYLSLLPQIDIYSTNRPHLRFTDPNNPIFIRVFPFATFEDLKESIYLMEYADGVRPYILEWYHKVFLVAYNAKEKIDSKVKKSSKGEEIDEIFENVKAVTTDELVIATFEHQRKNLSKKEILETYLEPLINQNYINKEESELDKRKKIYYPVLLINDGVKNKNLFDLPQSNNLLQNSKVWVKDPTIYPSKEYLKSEIQAILDYSIRKGYSTKIVNHEKKEITLDELLIQYYGNAEEYFQ